MFVQDDLWGFNTISIDKFSLSKFLVMFIGVVIAPLILLVVGGRDPNIQSQPGVSWYFIAIVIFLMTGIGLGMLMFRRMPDAIKSLTIMSRVCKLESTCS